MRQYDINSSKPGDIFAIFRMEDRYLLFDSELVRIGKGLVTSPVYNVI